MNTLTICYVAPSMIYGILLSVLKFTSLQMVYAFSLTAGVHSSRLLFIFSISNENGYRINGCYREDHQKVASFLCARVCVCVSIAKGDLEIYSQRRRGRGKKQCLQKLDEISENFLLVQKLSGLRCNYSRFYSRISFRELTLWA